MNRPDPAAVLNGVPTGHICDRCSARIEYGDEAGMYVTFYERGGWTSRRMWCLDCCPEDIDPGTESANEALLIGVFFNHRLAGVRDRSRT